MLITPSVLSLLLLILFQPGCGPNPTMSDLRLTLNLQHSTYVETASIPFEVILRNEGSEALNLSDFDPANQSVTLVAEDSAGEQVLGTQISWKLRNGERFHEPREFSTLELEPGREVRLKGDALEWLGVLSSGGYTLHAAYSSGASIYAESESVGITILPAKPLSFEPTYSTSRPAYAKIPVTWANEDESGAISHYLLETSSLYPPNFYRNVPVANGTAPTNVHVSTPAYDSTAVLHVYWIHDGRLFLVARRIDHETTGPSAYTLGLPSGVALEPALSTDDGSFHLVIGGADGLYHVAVSSTGQMRRTRLSDVSVDLDSYALLWDSDGGAHLVAKPKSARDLVYAFFNWSSDGPAEVKALPDLGATPRRLALQTNYNVDDEAFNVRVHLVAEADVPDPGGMSDWQYWSIDLSALEPQGPNPLEVRDSLRPYAITLGADDAPYYLFADETGNVWFYDSTAEQLLPVVDEANQSITVDADPVLLPAAPFSRKGEIFVGYLWGKTTERPALRMQQLK